MNVEIGCCALGNDRLTLRLKQNARDVGSRDDHSGHAFVTDNLQPVDTRQQPVEGK